MPNFRCQYCGGINQVSPDATHFTCKACGEVQTTPAFSEQVDTSLDEMMLAQDATAAQGTPYLSQTQTDENATGEYTPMSAARKDSIYYTALSKIGGESVSRYHEAIGMLRSLNGWRDSEELIEQCTKKIASLEEEKESRRLQRKKAIRKRKAGVLIGFPAVLLFIAAVLLTIFVFVPQANYKKALAAAQNGDIIGAYETFDALGGYKDSRAKAASLYQQNKEEIIKAAAVGDTVYFGAYEQDNNKANGKEDIAWQVLDKKENAILLLSVNGLDSVPYHSENTSVTWEKCALRTWLNQDFLNTAFTKKEQDRIIIATAKADKNADYNTTYAKDTKDKISILSLAQAEQYLPDAEARLCGSTAFADTKGVEHAANNQKCSWFLRTPGIDDSMVCYVQNEGIIRRVGGNVNSPGSAVRPMIWLNTEA